jgi:acyl-coenzyme A synthetase/AMP-(fatty) acid ligase
MANLYDRLHACLPADRVRPFASLPSGEVVRYGDLKQWSVRYANLLVHLDVAPGDCVAVQTPKSIEMLVQAFPQPKGARTLPPLSRGRPEWKEI